jgi:hypothetical protein
VIVYDRRGDVTQAAVSSAGGGAASRLRACARRALERLRLETNRAGRASFTVALAAR